MIEGANRARQISCGITGQGQNIVSDCWINLRHLPRPHRHHVTGPTIAASPASRHPTPLTLTSHSQSTNLGTSIPYSTHPLSPTLHISIHARPGTTAPQPPTSPAARSRSSVVVRGSGGRRRWRPACWAARESWVIQGAGAEARRWRRWAEVWAAAVREEGGRWETIRRTTSGGRERRVGGQAEVEERESSECIDEVDMLVCRVWRSGGWMVNGMRCVCAGQGRDEPSSETTAAALPAPASVIGARS